MKILILTILFLSVNCEDVDTCDRTGHLKYANNSVVIDMKEACKSKPCVFKCCDIDHFLYYNEKLETYECIRKVKFEQLKNVSQIKLDFSEYPIYKSDDPKNETKTDKDFFKDYEVLVNEKNKFNCRQWVNESNTPTRMLENGRIYKLGNTKFEKDDLAEYCVDKCIFFNNSNKRTSYKYRVFLLADNVANDDKNKALFTGIALLISSFFMGLVMLVYSILKELRNIQGMILMGYLATYLIGDVLKAIKFLGYAYGKLAIACVNPFYYGIITSIFFWMNVMSFDIWWTFRSTRNIRSIHRQEELKKFMWYGLYAWGTPAVIAIIAYYIDNAVNDNIMNKWCFISDFKTYIYLLVPIMVLLFINTLFFLMTLYNLWLIKRAMSEYDSPSQGTIKMNRNRFWVYIKLSLLMGVFWILDGIRILFFENRTDWVFILLNTPNILGGVIIFFMFVCKKDIYTKLAKKFKINTRSTGRNVENSRS